MTSEAHIVLDRRKMMNATAASSSGGAAAATTVTSSGREGLFLEQMIFVFSVLGGSLDPSIRSH